MKQAAQQTLRHAARAHAHRAGALAAVPLRPTARSSASAPLPTRRAFSAAAPRLEQQQQQQQQEQKDGAKVDPKDKKKQQQDKAEENDSTVEGRSPFAAFVEVLRDEVRKNREWQDSVKQLGGEVSKVQDSEAMQRAKAVYERARVSLPGKVARPHRSLTRVHCNS